MSIKTNKQILMFKNTMNHLITFKETPSPGEKILKFSVVCTIPPVQLFLKHSNNTEFTDNFQNKLTSQKFQTTILYQFLKVKTTDPYNIPFKSQSDGIFVLKIIYDWQPRRRDDKLNWVAMNLSRIVHLQSAGDLYSDIDVSN